METTSGVCVGNGPSGGPGHSMHWQSVSHGSVGAQSGVEERATSHGETWVGPDRRGRAASDVRTRKYATPQQPVEARACGVLDLGSVRRGSRVACVCVDCRVCRVYLCDSVCDIYFIRPITGCLQKRARSLFFHTPALSPAHRASATGAPRGDPPRTHTATRDHPTTHTVPHTRPHGTQSTRLPTQAALSNGLPCLSRPRRY